MEINSNRIEQKYYVIIDNNVNENNLVINDCVSKCFLNSLAYEKELIWRQ